MQILTGISQAVFLVLLAPLVQGIIKKTKAVLQTRQGPSVLQPYYDLRKYWHKDFLVSNHASWVFRFTPYIVFGVMISVSAFLPAFFEHPFLSHTGDLVIVIYLFALARFFTALAGVDTGSSFGAMGSSRDMFISILAEPVLFVTTIAIALFVKSTNLQAIVSGLIDNSSMLLSPAFFMVVLSFVILLLVETGRIPINNPDTHLELTMIHEGVLLEYSGKPLALMMWSSWLKQVLLYTLFIDFCVPWGIAVVSYGPNIFLAIILFIVKLLAISVLIAFIEMSYAKAQLARVPRLLSAAFILSIAAIATEYLL